ATSVRSPDAGPPSTAYHASQPTLAGSASSRARNHGRASAIDSGGQPSGTWASSSRANKGRANNSARASGGADGTSVSRGVVMVMGRRLNQDDRSTETPYIIDGVAAALCEKSAEAGWAVFASYPPLPLKFTSSNVIH